MEVPKFVKCPECDEKYSDKKKRRIIDSCGHPRCFSCLVLDNECTVCETILSRRKTWRSSRDSLSSTDDSLDSNKSSRGSTCELFSKENYLRMLYSYDPETSGDSNIRRGSFDLYTRKRNDRKFKLGQHSRSALVLTNSTPSLREIEDPRRNSADMETCVSLGKTAVSSSNLRKTKINEDQQRQVGGDASQLISRSSSGYWSEIEYYSDQEEHVSQGKNVENTKKLNSMLHKHKDLETRKRSYSNDENPSIEELVNKDRNEPSQTH